MRCQQLSELVVVAPFLQYFDFVTVWIGNKEKPRQQRIILFEFLNIGRNRAQRRQFCVHLIEIVGGESIVAITVTMRVRIDAVMVMREFNFEVIFRIAQIDQRKVREAELVRDGEAEGIAVEMM